MATGTAAVVVASTAYKMYSDSKAAQAQAEAASNNAALKRMQAADLLKRASYNIGVTKQEGERFKASQVASYVSGGVALEGSALSVLQDSVRRISENVLAQREEADAKARALYMGADIDLQLSGDIREASKYQTIGTGLNMASQAALTYNNYGG